MGNNKSTVFIVDDDEAIRDALRLLMKSVGIQSKLFASANEFLDAYTADQTGCLVLDIRMPGMSGLDLQERLKQLKILLPVIFITGHGDVPMAVQAMQKGAMDFLQKPFRDQELLDRIHLALQHDNQLRSTKLQHQIIAERYDSLSDREQQVIEYVVAGQANKVIAIELNLSQRTVEIHRSRVMEKMQAQSLAHLVKMMVQLKTNI